jgi:uncharacterized protein
MQYRLLHEDRGHRTFAVILQTGDEAMSCLKAFAEKEGIAAAQLTAIGAFREARLAYFDWDAKSYQPIPVAEQVEVASLVGDIAQADGKPSVHVHAVLGRRDGTALAGHLQNGHVRPTLEVIVTESPAHLCKVKDVESGLALISPRVGG